MTDLFVADALPPLHAAGARTLGLYETEPRPNDFPQLPVREEDVVVWLGAVESTEAAADVCQAARTWSRVVDGPDHLPIVVLRLTPTARSLLTGHGAEIAAD
ncbi:MAG TPA: hypothetical protein VMM13_10665 [Euzebya sp.]|nr:hypothetical protein [Euzebya sp.]